MENGTRKPPRRRSRRARPVPADLTQPPVESTTANPRPEARYPWQREVIQAERQREARIRGGIDWTTCLVPGCGRHTMSFEVTPPERRDTIVELPLCDTHAVIAWKTVQFHRPAFAQPIAEVESIHRERRVESKRQAVAEDQGGTGVIYFIRHIDGIIKVGWTSNIGQRLRSYGPGAKVLCHYPGTRDDETNLHRQLRPALAPGREWYNDNALLRLYLDDALKRYGPPSVTEGNWTEPKPDLAAKPRRSA